ncbi:MAG: CBS domain-containing protein [Tissierellia bacterium]|jgi:acetoin utilization protein AcuB|nr:CBS and ACT domain-containing protein [Bacillota bacterium]NLL23217.1 CBS domain-containing protein [Tissierellia bacterium]
MFVKNRMKKDMVTIDADDSILDARMLIEEKKVRRLPVMEGKRLVGVISRRDIADVSPSPATSLSVREINHLLDRMKVREIMIKNPVTISPEALLEEAATLMREQKFSFLPVLEDGELIGVITESNIFEAFIELLGFKEPGTRFTIEVDDVPGVMLKLAGIIGEFGTNILHIAVYRDKENNRSSIVIGVNTAETTELEKKMEESGFSIRYVLKIPENGRYSPDSGQ